MSGELPRRVPGSAWEALRTGHAWPLIDPDVGAYPVSESNDRGRTAATGASGADGLGARPGDTVARQRAWLTAAGLPGGAEAEHLFHRIIAALRHPPTSCPDNPEPQPGAAGPESAGQVSRRERVCDSPRSRRAPRTQDLP